VCGGDHGPRDTRQRPNSRDSFRAPGRGALEALLERHQWLRRRPIATLPTASCRSGGFAAGPFPLSFVGIATIDIAVTARACTHGVRACSYCACCSTLSSSADVRFLLLLLLMEGRLERDPQRADVPHCWVFVSRQCERHGGIPYLLPPSYEAALAIIRGWPTTNHDSGTSTLHYGAIPLLGTGT
jgi:hypothetical protein